jgi:hypothetical protein
VIGFDVDGVLVEKPPEASMKWGHMNGLQRQNRRMELLYWYESAASLLIPKEPFIAISARKELPEVRAITEKWLAKNQPNCVDLFLLPISRTIENVVQFKATVIRIQGLSDFTEDNKKILSGLHKVGLPTKLWYFDSTLVKPTPYVSSKP